MKSKNQSGVVIYHTKYDSTSLPGQSGGSCYTGALMRQVGVNPVHGVAYKVTIEPIGAMVDSAPELWMYDVPNAKIEVSRAKKILKDKKSLAHKYARETLARHKAAKQAIKRETKEYYRWLGVKQFEKA